MFLRSLAILMSLCIVTSVQAALITEVTFTERTGIVQSDEIVEVWVTLSVDSQSDPLFIDHLSPAPYFGLNPEIVPSAGYITYPQYDPTLLPFSDWAGVYGVKGWLICGDAGFIASCGSGNYWYMPHAYRLEDTFWWHMYYNSYDPVRYPNQTFLLNPGESMDFLVLAFQPVDGFAEAGTYELYNVELMLRFTGRDDSGNNVSGNYSLGNTCESQASNCRFTRTVVPMPAAVEIDVDPWSAANIVKPDSNNSIIVAVMGSNTATGDATDFDVSQVDPDSLKLGVGEAPDIAVSSFYADFDSDTNMDAAFIFKTQDTGILCDDPDVTLLGETFSGDSFEGTDTIDTTDCETANCHP